MLDALTKGIREAGEKRCRHLKVVAGYGQVGLGFLELQCGLGLGTFTTGADYSFLYYQCPKVRECARYSPEKIKEQD
ncbi:MAG: hypothetical protein QMD36_05445 [Candidatus Aenigmarchaeota archaeon]|nr:hypothetical protein [Candidatus Aenigmarchaeota archaeon]